MAGEIWITWPEGATIYATVRRLSDGFVYDENAGSGTFEAWNDANIANYDVPLTDHDGNHYSVDFPAGIAAGKYKVDLFIQAGGAPTDGDWSPTAGWMDWDGTAEVTNTDIVADIAALVVEQQRVNQVVPVPVPVETKSRIYL